MGTTNLINSNLHNSNKGMLTCKDCGRIICNISDNLDCYKISYICKCGSMGSAEVNSVKLDITDSSYAVLKDNHIICPCCNSLLLALMSENYINIAFRIRCKCSHTINKFKKYSDINKRLFEYNL